MSFPIMDFAKGVVASITGLDKNKNYEVAVRQLDYTLTQLKQKATADKFTDKNGDISRAFELLKNAENTIKRRTFNNKKFAEPCKKIDGLIKDIEAIKTNLFPIRKAISEQDFKTAAHELERALEEFKKGNLDQLSDATSKQAEKFNSLTDLRIDLDKATSQIRKPDDALSKSLTKIKTLIKEVGLIQQQAHPENLKEAAAQMRSADEAAEENPKPPQSPDHITGAVEVKVDPNSPKS